MGITVSVMYPNDPGSRFDMDYYLGTHGPLVHENWDEHGLNSLKVIKGFATPDPNTPPPYRVIALLDFETLEAFQGAVKAKGAEVMGDIPNFTDVTPVVQISENID